MEKTLTLVITLSDFDIISSLIQNSTGIPYGVLNPFATKIIEQVKDQLAPKPVEEIKGE